MIILLGGQGIGKGTLGRIFQKIWTATYIQVSNMDMVTGNFNASLERAYIVFLDEALFVGDRRASNRLKSLVTEPDILFNEKHQPARQTSSFHRFIAATNANHFKNTERDDRRDFTLRVSESRKNDHNFWKDLYDEVDNGGTEALVHNLLAMDLSDFNVRKKPSTKEFVEQKILSLGPIAHWWYECLLQGSIFDDEERWQEFVSTIKAIEGIIAVAGGRIYRRPGPRDVVQEMKKLCPSAEHWQKQVNGIRNRGFILPNLKKARDEFAEYLDGPIDWMDAQESED
jgi:adenylate kinase family enzyme